MFVTGAATDAAQPALPHEPRFLGAWQLLPIIGREELAAYTSEKLHSLHLNDGGVDHRLRDILDRLGAIDVHWVIFVLQRLDGFEQVVSEIFDFVLHDVISFAC